MCLNAYFSNEPIFCEKIKAKASLIYVMSSTDFQKFFTISTFFVIASWITNAFEKVWVGDISIKNITVESFFRSL